MPKIGQIIKKLRKDRCLTQEDLAEQLNVTPQSVSKWENETSFPDISQVIPIANVFGVSCDVLFGLAGVNADNEVKALIDEVNNKLYSVSSKMDEQRKEKAYEALTNALKIYPNNIRLLKECLGMGASMAVEYRHRGNIRGDKIFTESVREANLIINYSAEPKDVLEAHMWLVNLYSAFGKYDKAMEHAENFPVGFNRTHGSLTARAKYESGDSKGEMQQRCKNISSILSSSQHEIIMLGDLYYRNGQYEDAIRVYKSIFDIIEAVYGEEKYTPPLHVMSFPHGRIANCYEKLGDAENALLWLEKAINYHLCNTEAFNKQINVETPLLRECKFKFYSNAYGTKNGIECDFKQGKFESLQDNEKYKSMLELINNLP